MTGFYRWLEKEEKLPPEILFCLAFLTLSIFFYLSLGTLFGYPLGMDLALSLTPYSTMIILKNAFGEEAIFRLIPFAIFFLFSNNRGTFFIGFLLAGSFLFGYLHSGLNSMLALGPIGIVLALAYLKFGGYFGQPLRGFLFAGSIHGAINLSLHSLAMYLKN